MSDDCLFCRIVAGAEPSQQVGESPHAIAIRDIFPRAPIHLLVITREHVPDAQHLRSPEHDEVLVDCFTLARRVADDHGIAGAHRVATNIGRGGGQMIPHLHFHVLGGRQLHHIDSGEAPGGA